MKTKSKAIGRTAKPKKAAGPAPLKRTRTSADQPGGIDLLRIADKVGLQQFAAEGFRDRKTRAFAALTRVVENKEQLADKPDGQILMVQFIREKGGMSPEEIFYGIDMAVGTVAWEDRELIRLSKAIDAKYKEYGAEEDDYWPDGEAPEDMEVLRTAFDVRLRQLKTSILRHHAENEMADLLDNDPKAYADQVEKGGKAMEKRHAAGKVKDDKAK